MTTLKVGERTGTKVGNGYRTRSKLKLVTIAVFPNYCNEVGYRVI